MTQSTKSLVARLKRIAVPLGTVAALLFAASFFLFDHNVVLAAGAEQPQISDSSIAPLVTLNSAIESVAAHVMPAVVNISVTIKNRQQEEQNFGFGGIPPQDIPPEFRHFFFFGPGNGNHNKQPQYEYAIGSGFIISPDGYIVTNHHVVNDATSIQVMLHDRRTFPAKVIGVDKLDDLAVIKIDATNLPTVQWGNSADLKQGETVLAFGSPFGSLTFSVTHGIVSAVNRGVSPSNNKRAPRDYIQTDAAINPGNSGGPLVDAHGHVIGIDTFIETNSGTFAGAGFAIPSDLARHYVNEIIKTGKVVHGFLGIEISDVTPQNAKFFNLPTASGALVDSVSPDTPASRAGLKQGDVIRSVNGKGITDATDLQVMASEMAPGTTINLGIIRNGKALTIGATLGSYHSSGEEAENAGASQHVKLGVSVSNLTPNVRQQIDVPSSVQGVVIENVTPGSPADNAGLQSGDVIMQVDRHPVDSVDSFMNQVQAIPAGQNVLLLVWSKQGTAYLVLQTNQGGQ